MMRLLLIVVLLGAAPYAQAQDTVRSDINYRTGASTMDQDYPDKRESKPSNIYFSLQANQLLRQLFGGSGSAENPYLLTYGFNNKQTGNGMLFGLASSSSKVVVKDFGVDRETKTKNFSLRVGYDKKVNIGKRWIAGGGADIFLTTAKSLTEPNQGSETTTKTSGWGFGPRATLLFNLSEKVYLGTEASWYFQWMNDKTEITFPSSFGVPPQKSEQKSSSFQLHSPTAIFLTLKF